MPPPPKPKPPFRSRSEQALPLELYPPPYPPVGLTALVGIELAPGHPIFPTRQASQLEELKGLQEEALALSVKADPPALQSEVMRVPV